MEGKKVPSKKDMPANKKGSQVETRKWNQGLYFCVLEKKLRAVTEIWKLPQEAAVRHAKQQSRDGAVRVRGA